MLRIRWVDLDMAKQKYIFGFMLMASVNIAAGTIDTVGQAPYEQCGYCHEYDGNSRMPSFPNLAGQSKAYLIKQLQDFRSGKRTGTMQATAELLTDDDITIVAEYFNRQSSAVNAMTKLSKGQRHIAEKLFHEGDRRRGLPACVSCHGTNARGNGITPGLAGQHETYLNRQLSLFKNGGRKNDLTGQMKRVGRLLTQTEISALGAYIARLPVTRAVALQTADPELNKNKIPYKTNRYTTAPKKDSLQHKKDSAVLAEQ